MKQKATTQRTFNRGTEYEPMLFVARNSVGVGVNNIDEQHFVCDDMEERALMCVYALVQQSNKQSLAETQIEGVLNVANRKYVLVVNHQLVVCV
jgi:NADH/NAD ratio-sensing transcriptional regulator Rex